MTHRIVIEHDEGVGVMQLTPDFWAAAAEHPDGRDAAIHAEVDRVVAHNGWTLRSWRECDAADLPADRTFRAAWRHAGDGRIAVDMDKARRIHLDRIRLARAPLLAALDLEYQRADERGDVPGKAAIARRKQGLRDLTETFDLSGHATPEGLAAAWPPEIPRPA